MWLVSIRYNKRKEWYKINNHNKIWMVTIRIDSLLNSIYFEVLLIFTVSTVTFSHQMNSSLIVIQEVDLFVSQGQIFFGIKNYS